VDVLADLREQRTFLTILLLLGGAGSAYEIGINRFYAPLADKGIVPIFSWLASDRHAGERNYANREAGEWATAATPATGMVQFNPIIVDQNTSALLYSERPTLAAGASCMSTFGGDPALCSSVIGAFSRVFPRKGETAAPDLDSVCGNLPIDFIAASDTDPEWNDRHSWVWTQTPAFSNAYVRLFRCR
jgi:hypothetical protein